MNWRFWRKEAREPRFEPEAQEERVTKAKITRTINAIRQEELNALQQHLDDLKHRNEIRNRQREIERLEDEQDEDDEEDGDGLDAAEMMAGSPESLLMNIIMQAMTKHSPLQAAGASSTPAQPAPAARSLTDAQLLDIKKQIPDKWIKELRSMTDEDIISTARAYYPDHFNSIDEDTKVRALSILRS